MVRIHRRQRRPRGNRFGEFGLGVGVGPDGLDLGLGLGFGGVDWLRR